MIAASFEADFADFSESRNKFICEERERERERKREEEGELTQK